MTYIIFAAGKGERLQPLTLTYAKTQYKLDTQTTILQRMVRLIRKYDKDAEIVVSIGYKADNIRQELEMDNVKFVYNPFYSVSGTVASLWFARNYLEREDVVLINGDIVVDEIVISELLSKHTDRPYVLVDSSNKEEDRYYVQVDNGKVLVLSKQLTECYGRYCHMVKLDAVSSRLLKQEVNSMINNDMFDQHFEAAMVQMIFSNGFELFYEDIKDYSWVEVDHVNDMLKARKIHSKA